MMSTLLTNRNFVNSARISSRGCRSILPQALNRALHYSRCTRTDEKGKIINSSDHIEASTEPVAKRKNSSAIISRLSVYGQLGKFRLSSLVVLTTGAGFLAHGPQFDFGTLAAACFGTALCAASANTFNQVIEQEYDAQMKRTRARPLPSGRVSTSEAAAFGACAGGLGVAGLYVATNPVVAALGAGNIILYAGLYTYTKRISEVNTWIGSVVGAIPPVMGWAAASGGTVIAGEPIALGALLFLWQFPHFFALSWLHREDYSRGGFQMVAVNDPNGTRSAELIMRYSLYLTAFPLLVSYADMTSYMFAVEGTAANIYLLYLAKKFRDEHNSQNARKVFYCSLWYLPLLLSAYVFHSRAWDTEKEESRELDGIKVNQICGDRRVDEDDKEGEMMGNARKVGDGERIGDALLDLVTRAKGSLRGVCVHEVIVNRTNKEAAPMCPKLSTDKAVESIAASEVDIKIEVPEIITAQQETVGEKKA